MKRLLLALAAAVVVAGPAWAVTAPRIGPLKAIPQAPYNESEGADARVKAAALRAKASHKLLLVDFGGNWCPDCLMLAGLMDDPAARTFVKAHYEVVLVDVGRFDKNLAIPARYGIAKITAVPAVVVVTPTGKILNPGNHFALSDANSMSPQAVLDQLAAWVK